MNKQFTHRDLDGVFARVLGAGAVLEYRDPNDGQSSGAADKTRHQYALFDGVPVARKLPAESVGSRWRDPATGRLSRREPDWEQIAPPMQWQLYADWHDWANCHWPGVWSCGGQNSGGQNLTTTLELRVVWMKSRIELHGLPEWPQSIPCPHCQSWIVWAEAGYVPGWRICAGCHRHWRADSSDGLWVLRRQNYPRFWPYG